MVAPKESAGAVLGIQPEGLCNVDPRFIDPAYGEKERSSISIKSGVPDFVFYGENDIECLLGIPLAIECD